MGKVQTVQQTGKSWKLLTLIAVGLLIWSVVTLGQSPDQTRRVLAIMGVMGGVGLLIISKVGAWWFHR